MIADPLVVAQRPLVRHFVAFKFDVRALATQCVRALPRTFAHCRALPHTAAQRSALDGGGDKKFRDSGHRKATRHDRQRSTVFLAYQDVKTVH